MAKGRLFFSWTPSPQHHTLQPQVTAKRCPQLAQFKLRHLTSHVTSCSTGKIITLAEGNGEALPPTGQLQLLTPLSNKILLAELSDFSMAEFFVVKFSVPEFSMAQFA